MPTNQNDKTVPVKVDFSASGVGSGYPYTDIENNLVDSIEGVTINVQSIDNGFLVGKVDFGTAGTTSFAGSLLKNNGKSIMVLISTSAEVGNPPFILVLTSK